MKFDVNLEKKSETPLESYPITQGFRFSRVLSIDIIRSKIIFAVKMSF